MNLSGKRVDEAEVKVLVVSRPDQDSSELNLSALLISSIGISSMSTEARGASTTSSVVSDSNVSILSFCLSGGVSWVIVTGGMAPFSVVFAR